MRILQVSSADTLGGGETHILQLSEALRARGHDVVIAGRRAGPLNPAIALAFRNSVDFVTGLQLRSIFNRNGFDIVHAHVARDYPVVAAAAQGLKRVKLVFTRHLLRPVKPLFLYRRVDGWIAPTAKILETLRPVKPKRSAVIPNWVDLEKFPFRPHAFHRPVTVGLLGQISPHKGHDDAIEAMRQLTDGFRLLIAGRGEPSYEATLKRKAAGLPVEFAGFVKLPDWFADIDILIVPSWEEPFGIVLLEAMASGIPVVATNCGGPAEIAPGLLIPPRSPNALAAAIRSVGPTDFLEEARRRVEEHFDLRKVVPKIEAFYREVVG